MRITFVLPYAGLAGGIKVVAIYADRLKKRGHEVVVISIPLMPLTLKQKIKTLLREKRWPIQLPEPSHFDGLDVDHRIINKYRPVTDDDVPDADVVVATWWETAEWVNSFNESKGRKYYFVQHHEIHQGLPIDRVKATYLLPLRKITISNWLMDILATEYGDEDVSLVPNSVDHEMFNAPPRGRQPVPTVGFMYSHTFFKGCDTIIEAINIVLEEITNLKIITFGACFPIEELPLPSNTIFHHQPSQEKIRDIYSSCDFWIFGSRTEGFGLPLLEAMACRTPVIATKAGAAPELVSQGEGVLVEEYSSAALARAIIQCLKLPEIKWEEFSNSARNTVTQYSWDIATDLFEKAISD